MSIELLEKNLIEISMKVQELLLQIWKHIIKNSGHFFLSQ